MFTADNCGWCQQGHATIKKLPPIIKKRHLNKKSFLSKIGIGIVLPMDNFVLTDLDLIHLVYTFSWFNDFWRATKRIRRYSIKRSREAEHDVRCGTNLILKIFLNLNNTIS